MNRYDSLIQDIYIDETKKDNQSYIYIVPCLFYLRRIAVTLSVIYLRNFVMSSLYIMALLSSIMIVSLLLINLMKSSFDSKIEIMNELFTNLSLYSILLFTDFVPELEYRYYYGFVYMALFGL